LVKKKASLFLVMPCFVRQDLAIQKLHLCRASVIPHRQHKYSFIFEKNKQKGNKDYL
jgi:hypothetical protein